MNLYRIIDIDRIEFTMFDEPVSLARAKAWLKVTFSDDDSLITDIIKRSRVAVSNFISLSLVPTSIIVIAELKAGFRDEFIEFLLPYGPILNAKDYGVNYVGVNYKNGLKQSDYEAKTADVDFYWDGITQPTLKLISPGIYKFVYDAGYININNVPYDLIEAILSEVAYRYEHRGDEEGYPGIMCPTAKAKSKPYKVMAWQ